MKNLNQILRGLKLRLLIQINRFVNLINISKINLFKKKICSIAWGESLKNLIELGYAKLPITADIEQINKFVNNKFNNIDQYDNYIRLNKILPPVDEFGVSSVEMDINSEIFTKHIFSKNLEELLKNYYQNKFWLRNAPIFRIDIEKGRKDNSNKFQQRLFHLDYSERQLTLVVFLNDLNETSTHTEYVKKSNNKSWFLINDERKNKKFQNIVNKLVFKSGTEKIIGKKGEIFIFDAGNGLHRGFPGNDRLMIHLNFAQMRRHAYYDANFEKEQRNLGKDYYKINIHSDTEEMLRKNNWNKNYFKNLF